MPWLFAKDLPEAGNRLSPLHTAKKTEKVTIKPFRSAIACITGVRRSRSAETPVFRVFRILKYPFSPNFLHSRFDHTLISNLLALFSRLIGLWVSLQTPIYGGHNCGSYLGQPQLKYLPAWIYRRHQSLFGRLR